MEELAHRPRGLILVTGTTGSGKSTTLASMIGSVNKSERRNIITIEDPIEYLHPDEKSVISQREIGADTRSFPEGPRRVLRQDPDIIMIGEVRDSETMSIALMAADTGHLVMSTLHTVDAAITFRSGGRESGDTCLTFSTSKANETRSSTASPIPRVSGAPAGSLPRRAQGVGAIPECTSGTALPAHAKPARYGLRAPMILR